MRSERDTKANAENILMRNRFPFVPNVSVYIISFMNPVISKNETRDIIESRASALQNYYSRVCSIE